MTVIGGLEPRGAKSLGCGIGGHHPGAGVCSILKAPRGARFAGSSPSFLGRERAAVDADVGPERCSPRYHACLAPESVEESSAAVSKPRSVWLRVPVVQNLKEACRVM